MSVCRMAEGQLTPENESLILQIVTAHGKKRIELLKSRGILDTKLLDKLAHSGRNGLIRYLRNHWLDLHTQTLDSLEHSPQSAVITPIMSSEATACSTQITQELASNHMDLTNFVAQLCTAITELQHRQSEPILGQNQLTQT